MTMESTDIEPAVPRMSIAHLMLLTLTTAVSIAAINVLDQRGMGSSEAPLSGTVQVLHVTTRVWVAGMLGAQLALAAIVLAWCVRRRPAIFAPGHWLLLGLGGEAAANLAVIGAAAFVDRRDMLMGEPMELFFFGWFGFWELTVALLWLAISIRAGRSLWSWIFLAEVLLGCTRAAGCLLFVWGMQSDTMPNFPTLALGSQLIWIGNLGGWLVGIAAVAIALLDRRNHRRDWLHVWGVALLALRIVAAFLQHMLTTLQLASLQGP